MNDKIRFDDEITKRLEDPLWEKRMHRSVLSRVRSEKRRRLSVAAALLLSITIGVLGFVTISQDRALPLTVFSPLLDPLAWIEGETYEEDITQQYLQWNGFSQFPLKEDEELTIVLGSAYYYE